MADANDSAQAEIAPQANPDVLYSWTDVTNDFFDSCTDLQLGELMHDSK